MVLLACACDLRFFKSTSVRSLLPDGKWNTQPYFFYLFRKYFTVSPVENALWTSSVCTIVKQTQVSRSQLEKSLGCLCTPSPFPFFARPVSYPPHFLKVTDPHSFPFLCSIFPPWMYVALNDIIIAWFELYQNVLFLSFTEYAVPEIQLLMLVTGSSSPFSPLPSFPHISCFTTKASRCAKPTAQFPPWVSAQSTFVEWNWARTDC